MGASQTGQFQFGDFILDVTERTLFRRGKPTYLPPRTFDTLLFLVSRSGQLVTKEELMTAIWPDVVVTDNALTRCVKEVRQALGDDARNPGFIETVPRVGYRFIAVVEEHAETAEPSSPRPGEQAGGAIPEPVVSGKTNRKSTLALIVLLVAVLAWVLLRSYGGDNGDPAPGQLQMGKNSVAVLPFSNFTENSDLDYYGEGVAEEVTNHLSLVDGLSVLAFNISSRYGSPVVDPRDVARELGVRYIVSGSLRRSGDALRVATVLLAAESGVQLWSMTEETTVLEAYSIQEVITQGVVAAMRSEVNLEWNQASGFSKREPDPVAYDLYLRGRSIWSRRGVEDIRASVDILREAVHVDPRFARGWSALASAYVVWPSYSAEGYQSWHLARDAAKKALDLDGSLAEPRGVLAAFAHHERDWISAGKLYEEALEIEPRNATINYWFSEHLAKTGRYEDSMDRLARARVLDPTYPPTLVDSVFALALYGRTEEAFRVFEYAWNSGIRSPVMFNAGIIASLLNRDFELARVLVDEAPVPDEHKRVMQDYIRVEAGERDAREFLARLESDQGSWPHYVFFVWMTSRLEAVDLAFAALEQRIDTGGSIETRMLWGPGHRLVEHDGIWRITDMIGLTDYWETVAESDFCSIEGANSSCSAPEPGTGPDSLRALLDTFSF